MKYITYIVQYARFAFQGRQDFYHSFVTLVRCNVQYCLTDALLNTNNLFNIWASPESTEL